MFGLGGALCSEASPRGSSRREAAFLQPALPPWLPTYQDRRRRTAELVAKLAESEARASEAEKKAQQKEADLRRKLAELAQAEERTVNDDEVFFSVQTSADGPSLRRAVADAPLSKLHEHPSCVS